MADRTYDLPSTKPEGERTYRAFRLNRQGGIDSAEVIHANDDEEALAIAAAMVNGHGIDLWERARCLGSFPPLMAKP